MSSSIAPIGPIKITSGNFTFFEVRVLGAFVGSFSNLAISLGVEATAIMSLVASEVFEDKGFSEGRAQEDDRLFKATWTDKSGTEHVRYAALISDVWTDAFKTVRDVLESVTTSYKR